MDGLPRGGVYDFPARPSLTGLEQPIYWSPDTDTSVLHLAAAPQVDDRDFRALAHLQQGDLLRSPDGVHFKYDINADAIHLVLVAELAPDVPLAALIPLGKSGIDRMHSFFRFWRSLHGLTDPGDTRMTRQQRRRLKHMIRATDGRRNDASYKEIAEVIFGVKRVASEPWKTSPLRDATMDLVKDGFHMIEVGYRKLLRHRRRF